MSKPGWYPDPQSSVSGQLRWWDGEQWTSETVINSTVESASVTPATTGTVKLPPLPPKIGSRLPPAVKTVSDVPAVEGGETESSSFRLPPPLPKVPRTQARGSAEENLPPSSQPANSAPKPSDSLPDSVKRESLASLPPRPPENLKRLPAPPPLVGSKEEEAVDLTFKARNAGLFYGMAPENGAKDKPVAMGDEPEQVADFELSEQSLSPDDEPKTKKSLFGKRRAGDKKRNKNKSVAEEVSITSEPVKQNSSKKFWTKKSITVIGLATLVAVTVPVGAHLYKEASLVRADSTLNSFISSVNKMDDSWVNSATPDSFVEGYIPFVGDAEVADIVGLQVSVEGGDVTYFDPCGRGSGVERSDPVGCSNTASAGGFVTYKIGDDYSVTLSVDFLMSRPFYYEDGEPSLPVPDRTPVSVGEWSVSDIVVTGVSEDSVYYESFGDENFLCSSMDNVFVDLSETARIYETLSSTCVLGEQLPSGGENVDLVEFVSVFPVYNEATIIDFDSVTGLEYGILPYSQYEVETDAGVYLLTFVLEETADGSQKMNKLMSVFKKSEQ